MNKHRFGSAKEGARQIVEKIARRSDDALIGDAMAIGGNPDTVCRQVEKWAEVGIDQMIFNVPGRPYDSRPGHAVDRVGRRQRLASLRVICALSVGGRDVR